MGNHQLKVYNHSNLNKRNSDHIKDLEDDWKASPESGDPERISGP